MHTSVYPTTRESKVPFNTFKGHLSTFLIILQNSPQNETGYKRRQALKHNTIVFVHDVPHA